MASMSLMVSRGYSRWMSRSRSMLPCHVAAARVELDARCGSALLPYSRCSERQPTSPWPYWSRNPSRPSIACSGAVKPVRASHAARTTLAEACPGIEALGPGTIGDELETTGGKVRGQRDRMGRHGSRWAAAAWRRRPPDRTSRRRQSGGNPARNSRRRQAERQPRISRRSR